MRCYAFGSSDQIGIPQGGIHLCNVISLLRSLSGTGLVGPRMVNHQWLCDPQEIILECQLSSARVLRMTYNWKLYLPYKKCHC